MRPFYGGENKSWEYIIHLLLNHFANFMQTWHEKKTPLDFGNSSLDTWNIIHYLKGRKWQNKPKTLATIGKIPLQNHLVSFSKFWHRATFDKENFSLYYFDQNSYWSPFIFKTKCWYIKTVYCWDMLLRWVMMVLEPFVSKCLKEYPTVLARNCHCVWGGGGCTKEESVSSARQIKATMIKLQFKGGEKHQNLVVIITILFL